MALGEEPQPDGDQFGTEGGTTTPPDASREADLRKAIEQRDSHKKGERELQAEVLAMRHSLPPEDQTRLAELPRDQQENAAKAMAYDRIPASGSPSTQGAPAQAPAEAPAPAPVDQAPAGAAAMASTPGGPAAPPPPAQGEQVLTDALLGAKSQAELDAVLREAQGQVRRGEIADPVAAYKAGER